MTVSVIHQVIGAAKATSTILLGMQQLPQGRVSRIPYSTGDAADASYFFQGMRQPHSFFSGDAAAMSPILSGTGSTQSRDAADASWDAWVAVSLREGRPFAKRTPLTRDSAVHYSVLNTVYYADWKQV